MEYNAAIKKDEFMSFAGTWTKLATIILSKLTQEQKTKHGMFSLIIEMGLHHVGPAGLKLLTSSDPPASVSQSAGITAVSHHIQPNIFKDSGENASKLAVSSQIPVVLLDPVVSAKDATMSKPDKLSALMEFTVQQESQIANKLLDLSKSPATMWSKAVGAVNQLVKCLFKKRVKIIASQLEVLPRYDLQEGPEDK
ncbi:retrotransposable element ORF2 protein [Plecturocebus cupreus]